MITKLVLTAFVTVGGMQIWGQTMAPFDILIEEADIAGVPGLQSFTYGTYEGKWLVFGGRVDGLHRRQPFASMDAAGRNDFIYVIEPNTQQVWNYSLTLLPDAIREQMSSTNMEFEQEGDVLYVTGGYGYSETADEHITYPTLLAIDIPCMMNAIMNDVTEMNCIRSLNAELFAVTGGHLDKIGDVYHLVGGQRFTGRYNPMGPDMGPGFEQEYTSQVRRFTIEDDGENLSITELEHFTDIDYLHRRDYNVLAQILPNGNEALTAFSGVFQVDADIPYLHSTTIESDGYTPNIDFAQYLNHYHCATIPIYSAESNEMHNVFFGGIAQYTMEGNELVQDNEVPFVKTIARVTRDANGNLAEFKLPVEMPDWLGSGAEFIRAENLPVYGNDVIQFDELSGDSILLGYIYGGIQSTAANIFWDNEGDLSIATHLIYKVYLNKETISQVPNLNTQSNSSLLMQIYPNPNDGNFHVRIMLKAVCDVTFSIFDMEGKELSSETFKQLESGEVVLSQWLENLHLGGTYIVRVVTPYETAEQRVIVKP
jgi:hypothetical protein